MLLWQLLCFTPRLNRLPTRFSSLLESQMKRTIDLRGLDDAEAHTEEFGTRMLHYLRWLLAS